MPLPVSFDTIVLNGKFADFTGAAPSGGEIDFEPNADVIKHISSDLLIYRIKRTATLGVDGSFSITLPITNDPDVTPFFQYVVTERINGVKNRTYNIEIPLALLPGPVNLADLQIIGALPVGTTALTKAVGDTLYAPLGSTGGSVDDAAVAALVTNEATATYSELVALIEATSPAEHEHAISDITDLSTTLSAKANLTAVLQLNIAGNQTITGPVTFSDGPVVPDDSFTIAKIENLQETLDGLGTPAGAVLTTTNQTVGGVKTFTSAPVVPDGSWSIADTLNLQTELDNRRLKTAPTAFLNVWTGSAWTYATLSAANSAGMGSNDQCFNLGNPGGTPPSWMRDNDVWLQG